MRRAAIAVLLAAAALAGLTACAPDHGVIHAKAYTPAHTTFTTSCSLIGKITVCHPVPLYEGPEWSFDLYASKDDHGWHDVDEHDYDTHQVGDYYGTPR